MFLSLFHCLSSLSSGRSLPTALVSSPSHYSSIFPFAQHLRYWRLKLMQQIHRFCVRDAICRLEPCRLSGAHPAELWTPSVAAPLSLLKPAPSPIQSLPVSLNVFPNNVVDRRHHVHRRCRFFLPSFRCRYRSPHNLNRSRAGPGRVKVLPRPAKGDETCPEVHRRP